MKQLRLHFSVFLAWCCYSLLTLNTVSWGVLKDPGMSESEIRSRWKAFERIKDKAPVQGHYPYMSCFEKASQKYNIPLSLLIAIARGESNFDPRAKSDKSCYGIMQIRWPGTAKDLGITRKRDLFDPCINIDAGAKYLSWLFKKFNGKMYLAVSAYNYGPNAVAPQKVPKGAQWYAAYVNRHLQHVLSKPYEEAKRMLILEYTSYRLAARHLAGFEKRLKDIPFEIFRSRKYSYDLYFTYRTSAERKAFLNRFIQNTGIKPLGMKRSKEIVS